MCGVTKGHFFLHNQEILYKHLALFCHLVRLNLRILKASKVFANHQNAKFANFLPKKKVKRDNGVIIY
ncbi:hypothetical protein BGP_4289 [Beggiatoa sp. PS]|nr:hypothetical protein BGP_4289 [Beggiatoa sp. PS]